MYKMIPKNCYLNRSYPHPDVSFQLYKNGEFILRKQGPIVDSENFVSVYGFEKDDNFTITVQMDWNYQKVHQDYSIIVYSKHNIKI